MIKYPKPEKKKKTVKKRVKKLTVTKVQDAFNRAIRERDEECVVKDWKTPCSDRLECSHFFPVGGNSCLRYYPFNAFGQCSGHHLSHHNRNPMFFAEYMREYHKEELEWMDSVRGKKTNYSQPNLRDIYELCLNKDLDGLRDYIRNMLK